jgi:hypothetical protein
VPFVRFSRDKRGYESLYLVEPVTRRGKSRNRILYWYRTPPGVKIGRLPFDDLVKRTLEAQYPNVSFDWQKLIDTPIPPPAPDVERWRERRRAEKAAKLAAATEATTEFTEPASEEEPENEEPGASIVEVAGVETVLPAPDAGSPAGAQRKRRRRRGGRRGRPDVMAAPGAPAAAPATDESMPQPPVDSVPEPDEE